MTTITLGTYVNVDYIGLCKVSAINGDECTLTEIANGKTHARPVAWCETRVVNVPSLKVTGR